MAAIRGRCLDATEALELLEDMESEFDDTDNDPDYKTSDSDGDDSSDDQLFTTKKSSAHNKARDDVHDDQDNTQDDGQQDNTQDDGQQDNTRDGGQQDNAQDNGQQDNRRDNGQDNSQDGEQQDNTQNDGQQDNTPDEVTGKQNTQDDEQQDNTQDDGQQDNTRDGGQQDNTQDNGQQDNTHDNGQQDNSQDNVQQHNTQNDGQQDNTQNDGQQDNTHDEVTGKQNTQGSRKRQANRANWKRNVRKKLKLSGKQHVNSAGKLVSEKTPIPCNCNCRYKCNMDFNEDDRAAICKAYWDLADYKRQKDYLLSRIEVFNVQRVRVQKNQRKRARNQSILYSFPKMSTEKLQQKRVCKKFFLSTLNISFGPIKTAIKHATESSTFEVEDNRGKRSPSNKTKPDSLQFVRNHINSFPRIASHYTRRDSKRYYLDPNLSISKMYRLYTEKCNSAEPPLKPVGDKVYRNIFCDEFNLSFYHPKKDQCSKCTKYNLLIKSNKGAFEAEHDLHLKRKVEAQAAKAQDKGRSVADPTFIAATFDLQSVLQIPSSPASLLYYSRKLSVYNLCIYTAKPNDAFCYCWSEVEGGRGSNEIATCLYKWLCQLPGYVKEVSLFSDTCGGQNRNQNVAAMFLHVIQTTQIEKITHNFLESGHSHMECDSMHAAIEHEKRHTNVFSMLDWISIFQRSRRIQPYRVTNFHHLDFINFQSLAEILLKNKRRNSDGGIVNWLLVKGFQYRKSDPCIIFYRYDYGDEFKEIHVHSRGRPASSVELKKVYQNRLPISQAKKSDLQKLCKQFVIPEELHKWYDDLPCSNHSKDQLPIVFSSDDTDNDADD